MILVFKSSLKKILKFLGCYELYTTMFNNSYQIYRYIKFTPVRLNNYFYCWWIFRKTKERFIAVLPMSAIGPTIMFFEYYLRYCYVNNLSPKKDLIIISSKKKINEQFFKMASRESRILVSDKLHSAIVNGGNHYLSRNKYYIKDDVPKSIRNGHIYLPSAPQFLKFNDAEEKRGQSLLRKLGIKEGEKFICVHNHNSDYWSSRGITSSGDSYRSSSWLNLEGAIENLSKNNFKVIRAGFYSEIPVNCLSIMGLSKSERDFMDFYIQKECYFSICGDSGIGFIPWMFKRPILYHNLIPLGESPTIERGIVIPKLIKSISLNRFLSIRELLKISHTLFSYDRGHLSANKISADLFQSNNLYEKFGLIPVENSVDEIENGVKEILSYVNGNLHLDGEQLKLQSRFKNLFPLMHQMRRSPNYFISPSFLSKNKFLLD